LPNLFIELRDLLYFHSLLLRTNYYYPLLECLLGLTIGSAFYFSLKESFLCYKTTTPVNNDFIKQMISKNYKPNETSRRNKSLKLNVILLVVGLILFLSTFIPVDLGLDYILNLKSGDHAEQILKTILGVEGSLLTLFFAVLLLMFNSSKETLGRNAFSRISVSENHLFTYLFGIITSIFFTFISYLIVREELRTWNIAQTYFSALLLVALLILLIPVIYKTIKGTASLKLIDELFGKIDANSIDNLFEQKRKAHNAKSIEVLQSHPIYLLNALVKKHIDLEDQLAVQLIFKSSINKSIKLLGEQPTRDKTERTIEAFNSIWNSILHKASEKNEIALLEHFNELFREVNKYWAKNELPLRYLEPFFDIITEAFEKFGKYRFTTLLSNGIMQIEFSFNDHLKYNCPSANEIPELGWTVGKIYNIGEIDSGSDSNYQWNTIRDKYEDYFRQLFKISIETNNSKLLYSMFMSAGSAISSIENMDIEEPKKHLLIISLFYSASHYYLEAIDKGVVINSDDCSFIRHGPINDMIENDRKYFKIILRAYGQLMIDVAHRGKLGAHFSWLFGISKIGRFCAMHFEESPRYKESLFFVIDVLAKVKIELEPVKNETLDQYYSIYTDLESFRSVHKKSHEGRSSNALSRKVNTVKRSFKNIDDLKKSIQDRFINFN